MASPVRARLDGSLRSSVTRTSILRRARTVESWSTVEKWSPRSPRRWTRATAARGRRPRTRRSAAGRRGRGGSRRGRLLVWPPFEFGAGEGSVASATAPRSTIGREALRPRVDAAPAPRSARASGVDREPHRRNARAQERLSSTSAWLVAATTTTRSTAEAVHRHEDLVERLLVLDVERRGGGGVAPGAGRSRRARR